MNYETVTLEAKTITGYAARTNNAAQDMGAVIGGLWQKLYTPGNIEAIPGRVGQEAYGLYTNYASDANGDYDVLAGVQTAAPAPTGALTSVTIPAGRYAKFSIVADMHGSGVGAVWQDIWQTPLNRAYTVDFEEYLPFEAPSKAPVNLYIALAD